MANLALAKGNLGETPSYIFHVDHALSEHRRVSNVGREQVGEFRLDVSFSLKVRGPR